MEPNLQKERKAIYHFSAEFDFSNFSLELAMTDFNPRQGWLQQLQLMVASHRPAVPLKKCPAKPS